MIKKNAMADYKARPEAIDAWSGELTKYPVDLERLKEVVAKSKYSLSQISCAISNGNSPTLVYHWIDGRNKRMKYKNAMALCEFLHVPYEYLFHPPFSDDPKPLPVTKGQKQQPLFEIKRDAKEENDRSDDLDEIKKLLVSINNGIANLCKKWE